jgi:hypothetical protein
MRYEEDAATRSKQMNALRDDHEALMSKSLVTPAKNVYTSTDYGAENVDHPSHYGGDTTYEVIKVLEAWGLMGSFCLGNTIKYIARCGKKNDKVLEDLKKARWYLDREITNMEKK